MPSILIVDDEPGVRSALGGVLRDEGYDVDAVDSGESCLERLSRQTYDVVVLDIWLPGMDGLATLTRMRERQIDVQVVIISGHGNIESAVRAIKMGAFDFVEKPLSLEKTVLVVRNALRQRDLEAENRALRARVDAQHTMVGESYAMVKLREQVAMAAPTNGRVLIFGENGTGKELVARNIHQLSRRRAGPFVEVNCAAIPEDLIESELFGHVRGAFTGAVADRRGKFEAAHGGTIFLDEIADMSLKTQAKVLRVLQEQVMEAVGGSSADQGGRARARGHQQGPDRRRFGPGGSARICTSDSTSSRFSCRRFATGRMTSRCSPTISWPCWRASTAVARRRSTADALIALRQYPWPGNVRELRNVVERLMIMVPGDRVSSRDLSFLDQSLAPGDGQGPAEASSSRRRFTKRATSSSATTSCAPWPPSRATSRAPPRCSASSAATSTARCAASALHRRAAARTRKLRERRRDPDARARRRRRGDGAEHPTHGGLLRVRAMPASAPLQGAQDAGDRPPPARRRIVHRTDLRDGLGGGGRGGSVRRTF